MKRIFIFIVALAFSCNFNNGKKIDKDHAKFSTTADSRLFFKNVRQIYYNKEIKENTKLEVFRFSKRNLTQHMPAINLALVNNWMYDEAYVLIEPNSYFDGADTIEVEWTDKPGKQSGVYRFSLGSKETHFKFASQIYESILSKHRLLVYNQEKQWVNLFQTETDKDNFRKTMVDYYRLVNLY